MRADELSFLATEEQGNVSQNLPSLFGSLKYYRPDSASSKASTVPITQFSASTPALSSVAAPLGTTAAIGLSAHQNPLAAGSVDGAAAVVSPLHYSSLVLGQAPLSTTTSTAATATASSAVAAATSVLNPMHQNLLVTTPTSTIVAAAAAVSIQK